LNLPKHGVKLGDPKLAEARKTAVERNVATRITTLLIAKH
jgi:hypothetical protein